MQTLLPFKKIKEANEQVQVKLQTAKITDKMLTIEQKLNSLLNKGLPRSIKHFCFLETKEKTVS